ncbi:hypothetical protein [Enterobacter hormaechei]|uniref:hypothetical protein n=1 Tax=Enterobacter hormaechei TaxID=158836 RepID=UPI001BE03DBC|nr:hypothetical protein [Enterobacter hormaechei]MBT2062886.1 hypothetical protein [Enterobacter hormaechei subsp. xiangfangensis]MCW4943370.1 hypothetical protein [Enterobacter hormaechei subsp. xiangfangensis]MCW5040163.1 hypothetical protein [Enterobacter hormaechei subsp. xiangfangensis]
MGKMTFVFEYEDGKEPPVNAGMEVAGGQIVAASWFDYRDDFFTGEQVDVIAKALEELNAQGEISDEDTSSLLEKIDLLTL